MELDGTSLLGKNLTLLSADIIFLLQTRNIKQLVDESTRHHYRGSWERVDIKKELLEPYKEVLDIDALAVEIISTADIASEVHYHNDAYAVVTLLGGREGFPEPENCIYYFYSKAVTNVAVSGITLQILPKVIHGFRSLNGMNRITFLSVQSKRINEDFYPV